MLWCVYLDITGCLAWLVFDFVIVVLVAFAWCLCGLCWFNCRFGVFC